MSRWWTLRVLVVVLLGVDASPQWGAPRQQEGSVCEKTDGGPGICRLLPQCPDQLTLLQSHHLNRPKICGFQNQTPVVCCGLGEAPPTHAHLHRPGKNPQPTRATPRPAHPLKSPPGVPQASPIQTKPSTGGRSMPLQVEPTTARQAAPPPPLASPTTPDGEKSNKACKEYSREVSNIPLPLIFQGKGTQPGEFPHMALLGYLPAGQANISWNCGATLISRRYVMTAAHCFSDRLLKAPVRVRLGEYDLTDDDDNAVDYSIKRWVLHPQYRSKSWYHDLALIELDRVVAFSQYIQPACLWTRPQDPSSGLIITGWGSTRQDGGPMSTTLLKGNGTLTRVEPGVCAEFFKTATLQLREGVQDGILCAMDVVGSVDTCQGDSGGPLQVDSDMGVAYYVVGVVSGGSLWCGNKVPSINTRVYRYLDWIEKEVWPDK